MPSSAYSAQGTTIHIGSGVGAAKSITGLSIGNPTIITASAHGFQNGDVVTLAGLTGAGAAALNGQSFVIRNRTVNTFAVDIDTTGLVITAAGNATPVTYTKISNVKSFTGLDGSAAELDKTNLDSTFKEIAPGIPDAGMVSVELDSDENDPGQIAARAAYQATQTKPFKLTLANGKVIGFNAFVKKFSSAGGVDALSKTSMDLRISGPYTIA